MSTTSSENPPLKVVVASDLRQWYKNSPTLSALTRRVGRPVSGEYLENTLGLPLHLRFVVEQLTAESSGEVPTTALDSISFYDLCYGLFLPLSGIHPDKAAWLFGLKIPEPPRAAAREELLESFLAKDINFSLEQKIAAILGDPFLGNPSTFRRDSLVRLLLSVQLRSRREILNELTKVGEVETIYAQSRPELKPTPALTALEVFETLRFLPKQKLTLKFDIARSLLARCGKLEAYFLAKLLLRKAGFGFDYQGSLIARKLAEHYGAPAEQVGHAMALTDAFEVARILARDGTDGLRKIQLRPLTPIRPALASGGADSVKDFPVWVERKYDGIRLMLHKSTGATGSVLCGAYTRNRGDWLELITGIDNTIKMLPVASAIVDGELCGTVLEAEGLRQATIYDVYAALQGESVTGVRLRYAAFDLIYLNGQDLTQLPLSERRKRLQALIAPLSSVPLPIPVTLAEGQLAENRQEMNRLYEHFRSQGYEGIISKQLSGTYHLAARDPNWNKRKPVITLDLVMLGAVLAVTTKETTGMFGSYVIGARRKDGTFEEVGDVAGIDKARDAEVQREIMREGLLTGRRIERQSSSGVRPGFELRPHIVVTVKFDGIARDTTTKQYKLRDPKLVAIRTDKTAMEADFVGALEEQYLKQHVG